MSKFEYHKSQKGLTLIEVTVAILFVALAGYVLASFSVLSHSTAKLANDKNTAIQIASNHIEKAKSHVSNTVERNLIISGLEDNPEYAFAQESENQKGIDYTINTKFSKPSANLNIMVYKTVVKWDRANGVGKDSIMIGSALNYE